MAAAKQKPALHQVPAPAVPLTPEQVIHRRAAAIRPAFERVLGHACFGCHSWEIDAVVQAEAEGDRRALSIVLNLITRRGFIEAQTLKAELLDEDTDTHKQAGKEADDDTIF
ncbi:hypothetical protein ACSFA2_00615 [Variovorax sp. LT2P21]|uniref:hypothetical protein n=1 Tax=Variovorax sp. LT2P21 TaxID=3443731 RepID=UPI003F47388B